MQADSKYAIGGLGLVLLFAGGTALVTGLRVLVLPVIFLSVLLLLYRAARPRGED
jgi:hypothetical protein